MLKQFRRHFKTQVCCAICPVSFGHHAISCAEEENYFHAEVADACFAQVAAAGLTVSCNHRCCCAPAVPATAPRHSRRPPVAVPSGKQMASKGHVAVPFRRQFQEEPTD